MILNSLRNLTATYTSVAKEYDVSVSYVTNLFDVKIDLKRLKLPEVICIDEVYLKKLVKNSYCFIIYSPQWRKIIDVLDSRRELNLIDYFAHIPLSEKDNVKFKQDLIYKICNILIGLHLQKSMVKNFADSININEFGKGTDLQVETFKVIIKLITSAKYISKAS